MNKDELNNQQTDIGRKSNTLPVMTYIAVMSVCFIINFPGIAVAPIEGKLKLLLHTSELGVQLLTSLPNFVIIPFVLLAGKLSDYKYKLPLIIGALILFTGCGFLYIFTESMTGLIVASCLLGVADGILIPFAMGFIVNSYYGKLRTRNLGIKSATSNLGTVIGSFVVGILITNSNWHIPFVVYLVSVIPLALSYWLKDVPGFGKIPVANTGNEQVNFSLECKKDIDSKKIWALIANNVSFTFITFSIVIYLPQLIQQMGMSPKVAGDIGAVFFISVLIAGFILEYLIGTLKSMVFPVLGVLVGGGIALIIFGREEWEMYCGAISAGFAFGIFQPLIYDKTSYAIFNPKKNIFGLSLVLTALYIAIAVEPFLITFITDIFKINNENIFVFKLNFYLAMGYIVISFIFRKYFAFSIEKSYYS